MNRKANRPGTSPAKPAPQRATSGNPVEHTANALRQADSRWRRAARYGWDKGGSKGGR
ncbi:hypothetical protein [Accumulibacter sp.]|uniref:hypothetical protein n=1 Tax=Candidatus Accumulibacter TaxID=327159 RepID=UPI0018FF9401|nr:hypothetical protein [Accumulibacter sp.]